MFSSLHIYAIQNRFKFNFELSFSGKQNGSREIKSLFFSPAHSGALSELVEPQQQPSRKGLSGERD